MIPIVSNEREVALVWDESKARERTEALKRCALDAQAEFRRTHPESTEPEINEALRRCAQAAQAEFLRTHADWTELIPLFLHWSYDKCWYTEAKVRDHGGLFEIDHFRPKAAAIDPMHDNRPLPGWAWLAYDWRNFRLSAPVANRLSKAPGADAIGKGTRFPLRSPEWKCSECEAELDDESYEVLLIDPCCREQVSDLSFEVTGKVVCTNTNSELSVARVAATAAVLGLDHENLCAQRRLVWAECESLARDIDAFGRNADRLPKELRRVFDEKRRRLMDLCAPDAEFAGTARAFTRTSSNPQIQNIGVNAIARPRPSFAMELEAAKSKIADQKAANATAPVAHPAASGASAQLSLPFFATAPAAPMPPVVKAKAKAEPKPKTKRKRAGGASSDPDEKAAK